MVNQYSSEYSFVSKVIKVESMTILGIVYIRMPARLDWGRFGESPVGRLSLTTEAILHHPVSMPEIKTTVS